MVRGVIRLFQREFGRLEEAALLLGVSALVSQLLALVRDRLLAVRFGAGVDLDIYYAAFRVPDLIYVAVASLVSLTVVIPVLVAHLDQGNAARAKGFLDSLFTVFNILMIAVMTIAFLLMPVITRFSAPGFTGSAAEELVRLSRLLLLSPLFLGLSNLFASITQSFKKFFVYALSPVFYNLGIIAGIVFFTPQFGLLGLGFGVALGALLHLLVQVPVVVSLGLAPIPIIRIAWQEVRQTMFLSLPRTLALSVHQLVILILVGLASLMAAGSVAVFNFAYNLQSVPISIVGLSYSVAAFPTLVRQFHQGKKKTFLEQVSRAARHIMFWSIPFAVLLIVLRAQVIRVILGAGAFDWTDTRLTAAAVAVFSLSLVAQSLVLLFVRAYYATGKTFQPLIINSLSSLLVVGLAGGLVWWFRVDSKLAVPLVLLLRLNDVPGAEMIILPTAFSLGLLINCFVLARFFRRDFGVLIGVGRAFWQIVAASIAGGVVSYLVLNILAPRLDQNTFIGIFTQGFVAGLAGIVVIVIGLRSLGNRELTDVTRAFSQRFWQTKVIAPEPSEM